MPTTLDVNRLCMGCMRLRPDDNPVCPHCGANGADLQNPPHQLTIFSILKGQYLVGKSLGQGGFGITYIGYDLVLDMRVAIKEYYPEGFVCRQATLQNSQVLSYTGHKKDQFLQGREAFLTEARVLAKLGALPHVVHVRDFFQSNGTAYIVMEYVEGETLKKRLQRNGDKLPVGEVLSLLRPVMSSLGKIHDMGLLHRDISPDNIIIRSDNGDAVLLDFGAAVDMDDAMQHSIALNVKHGYAPVEQYTQHSNLGPWSDVYAMSATIYRALTGKVPPQSIERAHGGATMKSPNSLGAGLTSRQEKALVQGLNIYAKDRIQSMEELSNRLSATPVKGGKGGKGSSGKGKKGLVIGLVCAGVAVAAGGLAILQPWQSDDLPPSSAEPTTVAAVLQDDPTATPVKVTQAPTAEVTKAPTQAPTEAPTTVPTEAPTVPPTAPPTAIPTAVHTLVPTAEPTQAPTYTPVPTAEPTQEPTATPEPTAVPTAEPTREPTWRDGNGTGYAVLDALRYPYYMANLEDHSGAKLEIYISEKDGGALLAGYMGQLPADGVVVLPDTVRYNNKDYPIIALCDDFLIGQQGLKRLYLPDSVEYISTLPYAGVAGVTICGNPGTMAEQFAAEMGYAFLPERYPPQATATPTPVVTPVPTAMPAPVSNAETTPEIQAQQYLEYETVDGGWKLVNYFGPDTVLEVPAEWNGKPVVEVDLADSDSVRALTAIVIPEGVKTLGGCLNDCPALAQVELPKSLTWVSPEALKNTPWMEEQIALAQQGNGLVMAGPAYVMDYVGQADEITLPDSVSVVGVRAFAGKQLRSIKGGAGLIIVQGGAFADMAYLEALSLPGSVLSLAGDALKGTNNLRMLSLDCRLREPINWDEGQLQHVRYLYMGSSVSFKTSGGLTNHAGGAAFMAPGHSQSELWSRAGITVVSSVSQARSEQVMREMGWPSIMEPGKAVIGFTWDYEYNAADGTARLLRYMGSDTVKELTIPATVTHDGKQYIVTELAENILSGFAVLETVDLPANLQRIGAGALSDCPKLKTIRFNGANLVIEPGALRGTNLFNNNKKELIDDHGRLVLAQGTKTLKMSTAVKEIAPFALYGSGFEAVTLPDALTSIGDFAFAGMSSLTTLTLPEGVQEIGHFAFAHSALTQLRLPAGANDLGCGLLTDTAATLYGAKGQIEPLAQEGYNVSSQEQVEEKNLVFVLDHTTQTAALQAINVKAETVTVPKTIQGMTVTGVLPGCGSGSTIGRLNIPGTVTTLLEGCFNDMPNLYSVVLEEGCVGFDDNSFRNCPKLRTIKLPASVKQLPAQAPGAEGANFQVVRNSYAHTWAEGLGLKMNLRDQ